MPLASSHDAQRGMHAKILMDDMYAAHNCLAFEACHEQTFSKDASQPG